MNICTKKKRARAANMKNHWNDGNAQPPPRVLSHPSLLGDRSGRKPGSQVGKGAHFINNYYYAFLK